MVLNMGVLYHSQIFLSIKHAPIQLIKLICKDFIIYIYLYEVINKLLTYGWVYVDKLWISGVGRTAYGLWG